MRSMQWIILLLKHEEKNVACTIHKKVLLCLDKRNEWHVIPTTVGITSYPYSYKDLYWDIVFYWLLCNHSFCLPNIFIDLCGQKGKVVGKLQSKPFSVLGLQSFSQWWLSLVSFSICCSCCNNRSVLETWSYACHMLSSRKNCLGFATESQGFLLSGCNWLRAA